MGAGAGGGTVCDVPMRTKTTPRAITPKAGTSRVSSKAENLIMDFPAPAGGRKAQTAAPKTTIKSPTRTIGVAPAPLPLKRRHRPDAR